MRLARGFHTYGLYVNFLYFGAWVKWALENGYEPEIVAPLLKGFVW